MKKKALTSYRVLFFLLFQSFLAKATEVPRIISFTKQQYQAHNQNWSLAQGPDHCIFVGNSKGLLVFDGIHWTTLPLPNNEIVRSVATTNEGKVFVGGFTSVGYWEKDIWGSWHYTSITEKIENFGKEEIWHFLPTSKGMIFQSFARMYLFQDEQLTSIALPGNVMFAQKIDDRIIIPVIQSGLYEFLPDGQMELIPGSELFSNFRIATILPGPDNSWLVGTQKNGIFIYKDGEFTVWQTEVNTRLKTYQLNKGLRLHDGSYAFGTIVSGVLITDQQGNIKHHINREVGLQNNTVLAMMEDQGHYLWVGMDSGIDMIQINAPLRFFQDNRSGIGTVYTAALFENKLYVGTNQGVFWKPWPSRRGDQFQLLEKSQGQVWHLRVFDGQLIGAHNNGTFVIQENQLRFLSGHTGSYTTIAHPHRPDLLLQGTYIGINVLRKNEQGQWAFSHQLEDYAFATRDMAFDSSGTLWASHPHTGIFQLSLDSAFSTVTNHLSFGEKDGLDPDFKPNLLEWNGHIIVRSGLTFKLFNQQSQQFRPIQPGDGFPFPNDNYKIIPDPPNGWFQVFQNTVIWHMNGQQQQFNISLLPKFENIVHLTDSIYLFCLDDGYALLDSRQLTENELKSDVAPLIVQIEPGKKSQTARTNKQPPHLSSKQLRFTFATPFFAYRQPMSYRLLGFNQEWSDYSPKYSREYTNLPPGRYEFQVKSELSPMIASFEFIILPKWHQTWWAIALLGMSLLGIGILLLRWHHSRLERQERKLKLEKERELQRQRMQANNERLKMEVNNKSRQLADSTMNLVRKNEILTKLKKELLHYKTHGAQNSPTFFINKLIKLVDTHLSSEEDWIRFEDSFNQLHDNFFKRLKHEFPDLTPGDLKLAAYLKMNLSSKEIAPLLNISIRGIENKRYRLRRKMNLDQDANLTEFLIDF